MKALNIINKRYREALKKDGEIFEEDAEYPGITELMSETKKTTIRFEDEEVSIIVLRYQDIIDDEGKKVERDLIYNALYENYYFLVRTVSQKYYFAYAGLSNKNNIKEDDLMQEFAIILKKCMKRFKVMNGGHYFKTYMMGEVRNHFIVTSLRKYFEAVKIPTNVFRGYRKEILKEEEEGEDRTMKKASNLGMVKKSNNDEYFDFGSPEILKCPDPSTLESTRIIFQDHDAVLKILQDVLKDDYKVLTFCLATGLLSDKKYKQTEIADFLGITDGAVSKRVNKARKALKKSKKVKALAEEFEFGAC